MLRASLQSSGYEVITASNGLEGVERFTHDKPDLVITDLAMPEMNGIELTRALRKASHVPIIVLSVRGAETMKVSALDEGADDYLTKPFSIPELLARIRALLRRSSDPDSLDTHIEIGDFIVDTTTYTTSVRGEIVHLTPKEFQLLLLFARSPGRVLSHKVLLGEIWGPAGADQPEYLRVLVASLRKKLERPDGKKYILSEPWVGYRFSPTAE
jgi:two-component system KDP operon response regulator KdpE